MNKSKNVCVVVLGDIGRSPRMQYHSLSLAEHGHKVDIICYQESRPIDALTLQPLVSFHYLIPYPNYRIPRLINYILKTLWQALTLMLLLFIIRKPQIILVQNPPAIPTFVVCWIYCSINNVKYIIDWHNYAHTIMALNVGTDSLLVKITKKVEVYIGQKAQNNFCVTNEMKKDLKEKFNISAVTLYDKPPEMFCPITLLQKHELIKHLTLKYKEFEGTNKENTIFTTVENDQAVSLKSIRPGLLVSSTSWTEDEDFSILLKALQDFEDHHKEGNHRNLPKLICVITGKGPLKDYYCGKIKKQEWQHVKVITPWLENNEYPLLLASSDLGVCLHTSSSGLDLPMKVVDMFGCGLPVCAYKYKCLHELIKSNENSFTFNNSDELSEQIQDWFEDFPNNNNQQILNKKFKSQLELFQKLRWRENWKQIAGKTFE